MMNQGQIELILTELRQANATLVQINEKLGGFPEPWPGYDAMTAGEIVEYMKRLDDAQREQVRRYEESHKNRKGVMTPLVNWNS